MDSASNDRAHVLARLDRLTLRGYGGSDPRGECWVWIGCRTKAGYGQTHSGSPGAWKKEYVHRLSYELHRGPIPDGLQIDHLCRNRACCNPAHLEPVTPRENCMRGFSPAAIVRRTPTCARGHSRAIYGVSFVPGKFKCRRCAADWALRNAKRLASLPK